MQYAGYVLMAVGAAASFSSAMNRADSAKSTAEYNANIARSNAAATRQQGDANAAAQQRKARLAIGQARAGFGASGVALEGSPIDVLEQSAASAELDRQNILYGSETRARAYETQAGMELWQGEQQASQAKSAAWAGLFKAGGSMFSSMGGGMFSSMGGGGGGAIGGATGGGTDATLNRMG